LIVVVNSDRATSSYVSNGSLSLVADTAPPLGEGKGFRPHDLLEAALASCMAISARLAAREHGMSVSRIEISVAIDRSRKSKAIFRTKLQFSDDTSQSDREILRAAVMNCKVCQTLTSKISVDVDVSEKSN